MKNNIHILYVLSFLNNAWFWLGVWVLYYLLFTNFTGIGFIEMVMIVTILLFEVPSGALADIIGKKKTLIIAFLVVAVSEIVMGFAMN
ncbi:MAG: MFS transporter, partial [Patescibacteria group bacterium]|nr:MFS transporter [Patescibacteria group bacterium]